eukprot:1813237-Rhodomonas_salina.1
MSVLRFNVGSFRVVACNAPTKSQRVGPGQTSSMVFGNMALRSSLVNAQGAFKSSVQGGLKSSLDIVRGRFASMAG